jgi:hypothetical protein
MTDSTVSSEHPADYVYEPTEDLDIAEGNWFTTKAGARGYYIELNQSVDFTDPQEGLDFAAQLRTLATIVEERAATLAAHTSGE